MLRRPAASRPEVILATREQGADKAPQLWLCWRFLGALRGGYEARLVHSSSFGSGPCGSKPQEMQPCDIRQRDCSLGGPFRTPPWQDFPEASPRRRPPFPRTLRSRRGPSVKDGAGLVADTEASCLGIFSRRARPQAREQGEADGQRLPPEALVRNRAFTNPALEMARQRDFSTGREACICIRSPP